VGVLVVGVLLVSALLDHFGAGYAGAALYAAAGASWVVWCRGRRPAAALQVGILVLTVSESVLAPAPIRTLAPLLVVGAIILAMILDRELPVWNTTLALMVAIWALVSVTTVLNADLVSSLKAVGVGAMWLAAAVGAQAVRSKVEWRELWATIMVLASVASAIAILESLLQVAVVRTLVAADATGEYVVRGNTILGDWTNRAQATFGHPIPLAVFLAVALVLAFTVRSVVWPARAALVVTFGLGILLTGSRSAFVAVGVGLLVFAVSRLVMGGSSDRRARELWIPIGVAGVALLAATAYFVRAAVTSDFSLLHRGSMVSAVWNVLVDQGTWHTLFGGGYTAVADGFASGAFGPTDAPVIDNGLASSLMMLGVAGTACLVIVLAIGVARGTDSMRAVILTILASFAFFDVLGWHAVSFMLFGAVGLANANAIVRRRGDENQPSSPPAADPINFAPPPSSP